MRLRIPSIDGSGVGRGNWRGEGPVSDAPISGGNRRALGRILARRFHRFLGRSVRSAPREFRRAPVKMKRKSTSSSSSSSFKFFWLYFDFDLFLFFSSFFFFFFLGLKFLNGDWKCDLKLRGRKINIDGGRDRENFPLSFLIHLTFRRRRRRRRKWPTLPRPSRIIIRRRSKWRRRRRRRRRGPPDVHVSQ